eukprot:CAMPEP_0201506414 /NCGR_PEP_ID=MMETSP0161_2-20130828/318_1 /ASSEMBLY_ACC=CAM_ASM_000251 /TAXON_ID=180227 /ORGANISM="Neoparamoeba aestuarina, Strain SoJaBio B1-5/56/2" /LENGTH=181 /DNA_ID=CAMNT_0047900487 /DNA_START=78 /DNA_END=623 /DNA_ORIENTATION=+
MLLLLSFVLVSFSPLPLVALDGSPECNFVGFPNTCCAQGSKWLVLADVNITHTCFSFERDISVPDTYPMMLGMWRHGKYHVSLVEGISTGLCLENTGLPVVGYCIPAGQLGASYGYNGCSCDFFKTTTDGVLCSDHKTTQTPVNSGVCPGYTRPPPQNVYDIYTKQECENYLASVNASGTD